MTPTTQESTTMQMLQTLVRRVSAKQKNTQPNAIAAAVVKQTPPELMATYYEQALMLIVPDMLRQQRNSAIATWRRHQQTNTATKTKPISANVAAIRSVDWERIFSERVATEHGWKLIGDCTADDLDFCAAARRTNAEREISQAEFYEDLALRMRKANVETARQMNREDLP